MEHEAVLTLVTLTFRYQINYLICWYSGSWFSALKSMKPETQAYVQLQITKCCADGFI